MSNSCLNISFLGLIGYDCRYNVTDVLDDKHLKDSIAIYNHTQNNIQISNILFENLYLFTGNNTEWYHYVSNRTEDKGGLILEVIFTLVSSSTNVLNYYSSTFHNLLKS